MIEALKAHLRANVPALKLVGGGAEFQSAVDKANPIAVPACYVFMLAENPLPNEWADIIQQRVEAAVAVVLVVRNLGDNTGEKALVDMDGLRKLVKDQVFGWQASPELDPFSRGRGEILGWRDGHLWWQDAYLTAYIDRSTQ